MATAVVEQPPLSQRLLANARRFWHWLTSPQVFLALIMLAVMFYMVIVPLYRMIMTTITYSENDLRYARDAVVGDFTLFHWMRMLTTKIGMLMTIQPLMHSLTISLGATGLAFLIGGSLAWLVVRTDLPGRNAINVLAVIPYIMPSWTIAMAWKVMFNNGTTGGITRHVDVLDGNAAAGLAGLWSLTNHHQQRIALLHLFLFVRFRGADVNRL